MSETPNLLALTPTAGFGGHGLAGARANDSAFTFALARDRVLLTLLALNLMLLAFFVVLNASASVDKARSAAAVKGLQAIFARTAPPVPAAGATRRAALANLRNVVADAFAPFVSPNQLPSENLADDRIDVSVPALGLFAGEGQLIASAPLLDSIASIVRAAPEGYRTELLVLGSAAQRGSGGLAALADGLVQRGLVPTQLYVGAAPESKSGEGTIALTFLLLEADESGIARLVPPRGKGAR